MVLVERLVLFRRVVALVPAALALVSAVDPLAFVWWLVAGVGFAVVVTATAGGAIVLLGHTREVLLVPPHQRAATWSVLSLQLLSVPCIPLLTLALYDTAGWDLRTSLACGMCAGYLLSLLAAVLVYRRSEDR